MKPSENNTWKSIPGWCTNIEGDYLYQIAAGLRKNQLVIDIGTYFGRSACAFALGCIESGARVITIDHYKGNPEHVVKPSFFDAYASIGKMGKAVKDKISTVQSEAVEFSENFPWPVHVVYVDNEHGFQAVVETFRAWWPKLVPGGNLLLHDSFNTGWNEVVEAVNHISENCSMEDAGHADSIRHFRKPAG